MRRPASEHLTATSARSRERLLRRYARWQRPEDLEQAACEGLIKAICRFEPERGVAFTSFAVPTILGELRRYVRDTAWPAHVPRSLQERVREVRSAVESFAAAQGRNPTVQELALFLGCDGAEVVEALGVSSSLSVLPLDAPGRDGDAATASVADHIGEEDPGFERVECLTAIEEALPALSRRRRFCGSDRRTHRPALAPALAAARDHRFPARRRASLAVLMASRRSLGAHGPEGVSVPLSVTHDVLAQLVCTQRPTVTSALTRLTDVGRIRRRTDKTWLLAPEPPPVPARVRAQLDAATASRPTD
jgi:RNA polymerase sigma factor (sigma-70 family)